MKGTMTIKTTDGHSFVKELDRPPTLDELIKAVGGHIEFIPGFEHFMGNDAIAYCNEEGKLDGLPINESATALWEDQHQGIIDDVLVGNIVILSGDEEFMEAQ